MLKRLAILLAAGGALACSETDGVVDPPALDETAGVEHASDRAMHEYEVTITNLTTGQPLSPGVVFTHTRRFGFTYEKEASEGLRLIAENGDPSVAQAQLSANRGVADVVATSAPIHRVGGPGPSSLTTMISAKADARYLSLAVMLICTNDGFAGLDGVQLPRGFDARTYDAYGYDAGTEVNDEAWESIVDACPAIGPATGPADGNARTAEGGVVMRHPGIMGVGDLDPALHGWEGPVARVTVRRIS